MTSRTTATDDDANDANDATQAVPQGAGGATSNADEYAKIRAAHANVTVREKGGMGDRAGREARDAGGRANARATDAARANMRGGVWRAKQ